MLARLAVSLCLAALWTLLLWPLWRSGLLALLLRTLGVSLLAAGVHQFLQFWPRNCAAPARLRLQWIGVIASIPLALLGIYLLDTDVGRPPLWQDLGRLTSFYVVSLVGMLLAGLCLLAEMLRHALRQRRLQARIDTEALTQAEREIHQAQLRLLRSQLRPQLVLDLIGDARERLRRGGSEVDSQLGRLQDYLRGALPQLDAQRSTLGKELEQAGAYLDVLAGAATGTLQWQADLPADILATRCPPRLLLVLVEQAVRLGLRLPEGSGRVDIWARSARGRCVLRVSDSADLDAARQAALDSLGRRLLLGEGESTRLQYWQRETGGCVVEVDYPLQDCDR
jgi:predicted phage tail protein